MFKWLLKSKNASKINEGEFPHVNTTSSFMDKVVYMKDGKKSKFPDGYMNSNGTYVVFEKDKLLGIAESIYESEKIDDFIESIEIVEPMLNSGECCPTVEDGNLKIKVRINSFKLGITYRTGYIHEYNANLSKMFKSIFAHEMIHARDITAICSKYGNEEFTFINSKNNKIQKMAFEILSEYSACKEVAKKYSMFDSSENIEKQVRMNSVYIQETIDNNGATNSMRKPDIRALNYAIATRCAYADASVHEEKNLILDSKMFMSSEFTKYIGEVRALLNHYYKMQPLNRDQYYELGAELMKNLLLKYRISNDSNHRVVNFF